MDVCDIGPARYWTLEWRSFMNAVLANAVDHPRRAFSSSNIVDDGIRTASAERCLRTTGETCLQKSF